ncbi:radical SAM family heme chaperone HemW [Flammeovirga sp. SubArs3]|uniref:radical SAM family heme chaperone HemW n=1 Tax=Flammeovirga sp. SubArs3 TaxID=2995316 RepID=UPI00248BDC60|nr:radical SAM family heme chaperone HemW [Flammeovirga sp. SubArs3]
MSGIYLHIPFCKQACHYCDFHFSTSLYLKSRLVEAMLIELEWQKQYCDEPIETIYFGGGTPSLLSERELNKLMEVIYKNYSISDKTLEVTLEANPDDINSSKLKELKNIGINRLSIGLQSFHEEHLRLMNRAHNAEESQKCVKLAQDHGFDNLTIDLIYGIPYKDHSVWYDDLATAITLNVSHISSYCLTVEDKTALGNWAKRGKFKPAEDEYAAEQFEYLVDTLKKEGFEHYEISNFAKQGYYSKHNSAYWKGKPYVGIGPSAHSFDGKQSRQFNVSNNPKYIKSILEEGKLNYEKETLSRADGINEYLLTTLRTSWGCDLQHLKEVYRFDLKKERESILKQMDDNGWLLWKANYLVLSEKGKLFADQIASDLFKDE